MKRFLSLVCAVVVTASLSAADLSKADQAKVKTEAETAVKAQPGRWLPDSSKTKIVGNEVEVLAKNLGGTIARFRVSIISVTSRSGVTYYADPRTLKILK